LMSPYFPGAIDFMSHLYNPQADYRRTFLVRGRASPLRPRPKKATQVNGSAECPIYARKRICRLSKPHRYGNRLWLRLNRRGLLKIGPIWDSGRFATVQLIRQGQADLTPLSPESTIGFVPGLWGKWDYVPEFAERAVFIDGRRALQRGRLSSTEVRPLPNEIAICRASLLQHAVLLRGVYERLPATALSRDARENTCARFLSAILEGGKLKRC
jgi:hypothetical protein